ncbi:MAG TPA: hypothetical protein VKQ08_04770 [Cyclobacteriaceae bacterium]|nr:hypothetical protein [Cyclobacteriaceae bacterium]
MAKTRNGFICINTSSYQYENDQLIREVIRSATRWRVKATWSIDTTPANLMEIREKRARWKRLSDGRTESEITELRTVVGNDRKGNPSTVTRGGEISIEFH